MSIEEMRFDGQSVELYLGRPLRPEESMKLIQEFSKDPYGGAYKRDDFESLLCFARQKMIDRIVEGVYPIEVVCSYEELNNWLDDGECKAADRQLGRGHA